jgi:predicted Zn-ribbon and HTH transcriptional regulator
VTGAGIEVHEQPLGVIRAERLYQMRCECGRPWFATELPTSTRCPACVAEQAGAPAKGNAARDEPAGVVNMQLIYRMRCECGRQWFELEVKKLAKCPACSKLSVVSF